MNTESTIGLVKALFDNPSIGDAIDSYSNFMVSVALVAIPLFYLISFVWNAARNTVENVGNKPKLFDRIALVRPALLWMLVANYASVMSGAGYLIDKVVEQTTPENYQKWKANHGLVVNKLFEQQGDEGDTDETGPASSNEEFTQSESTSSFTSYFGMQLAGLAAIVFKGIFALLSYVASFVVILVSFYLAKIFYVLGPLIMAFSILPFARDKLEKWFVMWLNLKLNLVTVNIISGFLIAVSYAEMSRLAANISTNGSLGTDAMGLMSSVIFSLVVCLMYVLSFWITSFIVGSAGAGRMLSTAAGVVTGYATQLISKLPQSVPAAAAANLSNPTGDIFEGTKGTG